MCSEEVLRASRTLFMHHQFQPKCYILLGIQPGYETKDVLVSLIDNWRQNLGCSSADLLVLLDFALVFDTINHKILLDTCDVTDRRGYFVIPLHSEQMIPVTSFEQSSSLSLQDGCYTISLLSQY